MDLFTGSNDLGTLALGLVIAGAVAGFASGAIGAGGGLVLVPSLYLVLTAMGVAEAPRAHLAMGTSLAALSLAALTMIAARTGKVSFAGTRSWGTALLTGALSGAAVTALVPGRFLIIGFAGLALIFAAFAFFTPGHAEPRARGPLPAFGLGVLATVTGIGLDLSALRFITQQNSAAPVFAAAAALIGASVAAIAGWPLSGLPEHSVGFVNLLALAVIAPPLIGGVLAGHHFADTIDAKRLRVTFALFITVIAAKMLWDVWG